MNDARTLLTEAIAHDRRALGRCLTIAERGGDPAAELDRMLLEHPPRAQAHLVGITGAPGAGKSTLTGALLDNLVARGARPAVLAVDPSSPVSGGAILGDRVRMDRPATSGAFIRSVATRGARGGLATSVPAMIRLLEAAGYDVVILETVGVGQVELDVASLADTTVLVLNPGWGDAVQANKAGLLELADVLVVNKADRPGADDAVRDLERMLDLSVRAPNGWRAPVICTVATRAAGVDDLLGALDRHSGEIASLGTTRPRVAAELRLLADRYFSEALDEAVTANASTMADVEQHRLTPHDALRRILAATDGIGSPPHADGRSG